MKNQKYYPHERNRYFFGKLLTVGDFNAEQKYVNDKRRVINRFLHGVGVVCGMNVVRVDDTAVSVEMGLALDHAGREILVDTPVIRKLSMIDGFDAGEAMDAGYQYLCIEYDEQDREPVHSIAGTNRDTGEELQFNKVAETYRLYMTSLEPEADAGGSDRFHLDTQTVYWGNGLRIRHVLPKFVRASDELELTVTVEKLGQQQPVSFEYEVRLTCLGADGQDRLKISFHEPEDAPAGRYAFTCRLKSQEVRDAEGRIDLVPGSFTLKTGERGIQADPVCRSTTWIIDGSARREVIRRYHLTAMEDVVRSAFQQSIYLAKIRMLRAGPSYVIEDVEPMPFRQTVRNGTISSVLQEMDAVSFDRISERLRNLPSAGAEGGESGDASTARPTLTTGTELLDLGIGGREGQRFFSREITHQLGPGAVRIVLGMAVRPADDSPVLFGAPDVFQEPEDLLPAVVAARVDVAKGTFVIGLRMTGSSSVSKVRVNWMAISDPADARRADAGRKLFVRPDMENVEVRGSRHFEAVLTNTSDKRVKWSVKEKEGGTINENGWYIAPNLPGVYEIVAESVATPVLKASAYVVVRETAPEAR